MADMAKVLAELQETVIVMAGIQQRQAAIVKDHGEWLVQHERAMKEILEAGRRTDERIEALVSAMGEFLRKQR
jgi:hypothetical protein